MAENSATTGRPRVLVIDDSRVIRRMITKLLGSEFDTIEAADGAAGWSVLAHDSHIDVVITDIQMPQLDGYGLICRIRAVDDPGLRDIPVVVITSAEDEITRERAYACGANDFILKPIDEAQLIGCVRAHVAEYQEATVSQASMAPRSPVPPSTDVPALVPNTDAGSLKDAVAHIDRGMKILSGLKASTVSPHALVLVLRFMPLLKYCNSKFGLGMDKEIAAFQQRVSAARDRLGNAA